VPRYRLTIEYAGTGLVGWQRQPVGVSVQGALETAIAKFCGDQVTVHGAGRTDAGVHALAQVAHVDLTREHPPDTIRGALNHHLRPAPVSVLAVAAAAFDFDARRSAIGRVYRYRILNRRPPAMLDRNRVWHVAPPLDLAAMQAGARHLIGRHDFSTFRDSLCQAKTPVKTLDAARVWREGEEVRLEFAARSFLHRQVRSMTGSLAQVGLGRWSAADLAAALEARDRAACGPVAPADGLCLVSVAY